MSYPSFCEGRRRVTILFADLTGFTELSTRVDPEDLHAIAQAYFDCVERIISRLGGSMERYIGDGVMVVFGARLAHDDDVMRAVRAGLEVQAAMPELSARFGRPLHCVVGIATGEVAVMEPRPGFAADAAVVGASVNMAARVESIGGPGEVLVSEAVYRQVSAGVKATSLGARALKGIDRPVGIWRIEALVEPDATSMTHLVGRRDERAQLEALTQKCMQGSSITVVLRGEPGIGKTRLLAELCEQAAAAGFALHRGAFLDFGLRRGSEGLHALTCSLLGIDASNGTLERQRAADEAVARGDVPQLALAMLYELATCPQTAGTRALFDALDPVRRERMLREALTALVRASARRSPLLLAVEDLHWADPQDVQRLAHVAAECRDAPILLALTSRVVDPEMVGPAWRAAGHEAQLLLLKLGPLHEHDMHELADGFTGVAPDVVDNCIARSGGNALFLGQLLRHASESGESSVPASISSLIQARVDLLPVHNRTAIQAASVLGQRFDLDALRHLLGEPDYDCEALVRIQLLHAMQPEYIFSHALIQEAIYASLLRRNARELHVRAAAWYEGRDAPLRARHLDRAGDPAAPRAYLASAVLDTDAGRYEPARAQLARGLEIAAAGAERVALMLQLGQLQLDVGQVQESITTYRAALEETEDRAQQVRAWTGLAAGMRISDDIDGAIDVLSRAEAAAREQGLDAELTRIHYLRGGLLFPRGDIEGCRREHTLALEHARRAGLPRAEADALSGLGDAAYAAGLMRTAYKSFSACMELCTRNGFGRIEAANRFMVATVRIYMNEFEGALQDALESAALARRLGHQRAEILSRLTAGWILITLARLPEARREAEVGLDVTKVLGAGRFRPILMESLARIELLSGARERAIHTIEHALQLARTGELMRYIGPWLLGTRAKCVEDPSVRREALEEGADLLAEGCVGHNYYRFYSHAIDASTEAEDEDGVLRWIGALEAYSSAEPTPWADFHIARGRALAQWLRTKHGADARHALLAVRAIADSVGFMDELPRLDAALGQ